METPDNQPELRSAADIAKGPEPKAPEENCDICGQPIVFELREDWRDNMKSITRFAGHTPISFLTCFDRHDHPECGKERLRRWEVERREQDQAKAQEIRRERWAEWYRQKNLPDDALLKTFEKFEVDSDNVSAFNAIRAWRSGDTFGFLLSGPAGTGKSHLFFALFNRIMDEYRDGVASHLEVFERTPLLPVYMPVSEFLSSMRSNQGSTDIPLPLLRPVPLFLDDLGTESLTDWSRDILFRIFEHRLNRQYPTFVTTNLSLNELKERMHERVTSRILGMCIPLTLRGKDRRVGILAEKAKILRDRIKAGA